MMKIADKRAAKFAATSAGYDVVVVGAGVNGAGIAWDASLRGLRVLLIDKGDVGSGTSSWSSKMIHGGLKYLEKYDVSLVRESLREREWLLQAAPHLVRELRFILPFYDRNVHSKAILSLGMVAYDVLSFDKSVRRFELLSRDKMLAREPGLDPEGLTGGAVYSDGQVNYAERLSFEIALAAQRAGATLLTYTRATKVGRIDGRVASLTVRDEIDGKEYTIPTRAIVNAAGPWIDEVWAEDNLGLPRMNGGTKGTHLVVDSFPGAPKDAFYYEAVTDGRPMMVIPWTGRYLIGSTDLRFTGDLDMASATQDEYDYILRETNKIIPGANLTMADVRYSYTGVRPLPYADESSDVSDITRRHDIRHHKDVADGLYTLVGGKLTTFRQVGQDFGDILARRFGSKRKSVTRKLALPGGGDRDLNRLRGRVARFGLADDLVNRLVDQYGSRAIDVATFIVSGEALTRVLDESFNLTVGEVEWAIRYEDAVRLADILARRTVVGLENDLGRAVIEPVADIAAELLGWDDARLADEIARYEHYLTRFIPKTEDAR
ncbi:glycerol-3-phosphate dehydrogenase/oxidase [Flaviflexus massiliensis]|uniref:glycerol-3-phosphate dehydrogenase/oxidase n=1 Tax=Flaviflexus massiliensis TaxID=1522309 RepID=UPI0009E9F905|nr:glycerol-3-phosphate dehydrogenase/oxidase [Flaviflexus massiliensis]